MKDFPREKVALVMFLLMFVVGGAVLIGYFGTGKSWTVAATIVDDSVGSMEDYTVLVFNGVADPQNPLEGHPSETVDAEHTMQDAYGTRSSEAPSEDIVERIMSAYRRLDKRQSLDDDKVYASDVRDLYELKGADVITVNIAEGTHYASPIVLSAGDKSVGVFSVSGYTSRAQMHKITKILRDDGADMVVCIAPRLAMVSTLDGLDVAIFTDEIADFAAERTSQVPTLVVSSPERGMVGVVLFSSNNVPSFKIIEEL